MKVKVIADSISPEGRRITTLQLEYPRYVHSELMTHRVFSRNASSSRAIPVATLADRALENMIEPIFYGMNQPGMQAKDVCLEGEALDKAREVWRTTAEHCAASAKELAGLGLHKQWANRLLEWFSTISVVLTSTEWENFYGLRCHTDAQPEIHHLADLMREAMGASTPNALVSQQWHLPYVTDDDLLAIERHVGVSIGVGDHEFRDRAIELAKMVSAARCCRVSYLKHDGLTPNIEEDLSLCERLMKSRPIHASPFEHQATPMPDPMPRIYFNSAGDVEKKDFILDGTTHIDLNGFAWSGNFCGWVQFRQEIEQSFK